ncbi:hypothetical protein SAMN05720473_101749 [Fibrobacter sp. UWB15]|jgi:hypothetical protein|uniref:hypothetical protein n=1 Tax=unclassified Fibrobacter TaxID=2634177 RepID=UPI00091605AA|nr:MULTISPECIES: hypothetical protein [unclassified Fibrobacter]PWJ67865.1 hypothetical protein BGW99_101749 [Fibrobacter sp. UWB6]SHF80542.1 hypothetical protein SAMN05720760_101714 [Fibrobacter sp. UWB8]SMG15851.1 hypothetical protein SAMN05720473_101749 [Fibrobacter sp. UWB15]
MSLFKNWKLILAASTVALFTACAGSSGGSSSDDDYGDDSSSPSAQRSAPKEKIDENKLKKTEDEAVAITEENHKLRKEIFEAKNKLGISTAPASEE